MIHSRTKIIGGIAGLTLVGSGILLGLFAYVVGTHKHTLAERLGQVAEMQANRDALSVLTRALSETENDRNELASRIVGENEVSEVLSLIETAVREQGIQVQTEQIKELPINERYEQLEIRLAAKGPYEPLMRSFQLLETLPYQSSVTKVLLSRDEADNGPGWSAIFTLNVTKYK